MLTFVSGWAGFKALFPGLECEFVLPFFHNSLKQSQSEVAARPSDTADTAAPAGEAVPAASSVVQAETVGGSRATLAAGRIVAVSADSDAEAGATPDLSILEFETAVDAAVEAAVAKAAARAAEDGSAVLAGWSTGAHILLKCCVPHFAAFSRVLLFAPFLSFTDYVPVAELDALSALVARSPAAALRGFYARCAVPGRAPAPPEGCGPALVAGLEYLRVSRAAVRALPDNVTVAHGEQDAIVPPVAATEIARLGAAGARFAPGGHYFAPELIHEFAV